MVAMAGHGGGYGGGFEDDWTRGTLAAEARRRL